jgi:hypothetical protein
MYAADLTPIPVSLDNLYLDPNNPRFWSEANVAETPDRRITEEKTQDNCQKQIELHGVEELCNSILRNGFLSLDRIVVRQIDGQVGKFVALEGNRRLAGLKKLYRRIENDEVAEEGVSTEYLNELKVSISTVEVLNYTGPGGEQIAWIFQGIRHISGIRDWEPAQRAKLLAQQVDSENMTFAQAGQKFGLTAIAVGRLYRAHKALEQMHNNDEYGNQSDTKLFTLFDEAYKSPKVRTWLAWDDNERQFTKQDHLRTFYSWIVKDNDDPEKRRRIHDPRQIKVLAKLLENDREDLMGQIERHEISIDKAEGLLSDDTTYDWRNELKKANRALGSLPNKVFLEDGQALKDELLTLKNTIERTLERIQD